MNKNAMEKLLWSIALPGFGQILNKRYLKGILFIFLEFIVNTQANFNEAIFYSFQGDIQTSFEQINIGWLMFYPCLYFFAMWDAVKDAIGDDEKTPLLSLPFVFAAYFTTVGLMYSDKIMIFDVILGPIFLPMLFCILGLLIGLIIKKIIMSVSKEEAN